MREDTMNTVTLNEALLATVAGEVVIYNYDSKTREYLSTSTEYLAVGVGIPACSCLDAQLHIKLVMQSAVLQILTHGNMCQTIAVKSSIAPKQENRKKSQLWVITLKIQPLSPR